LRELHEIIKIFMNIENEKFEVFTVKSIQITVFLNLRMGAI
jgi:hypothetical protein